jgi:hypothetical protein
LSHPITHPPTILNQLLLIIPLFFPNPPSTDFHNAAKNTPPQLKIAEHETAYQNHPPIPINTLHQIRAAILVNTTDSGSAVVLGCRIT